MNKTGHLIFYSLLLILESGHANGQMPMPDNVCTGETRHYYVESTSGSAYIWWINGTLHNGFSGNELILRWDQAGTYLLEVREISADGCLGPVSSGMVFVTEPGENSLIIYEAFSPNGDLINDVWNIGNINYYPEMEVIIYNRWGQSVWKSGRGYPNPWDGSSNGRALPVDSYHYVIDLHNGSKPIVGVVTIVR